MRVENPLSTRDEEVEFAVAVPLQSLSRSDRYLESEA